MKKILSLFLVLGLCFGLTGCGGNDNSKKETPKKEEKVEKPLDLLVHGLLMKKVLIKKRLFLMVL